MRHVPVRHLAPLPLSEWKRVQSSCQSHVEMASQDPTKRMLQEGPATECSQKNQTEQHRALLEKARSYAYGKLGVEHDFDMLRSGDLQSLLRLLSSDNRIYWKQLQSDDARQMREFFSPRLFHQLPLYSDDNGVYVRCADASCYLREYSYMRSMYYVLLRFCRSETALLSKGELRQFVEFFAQSITITHVLTSQFLQFYYTYVVNSLFFFLAEPGASSLPLSTLLCSVQLRQLALLSDSFKDYIAPCASLLPKYNVMYRRGDIVAYLPDNWYSPETALLIYQQFIGLDQDRDGLLKETELYRFSPAAGEKSPLDNGGLSRPFTRAVILALGDGIGLNFEGFLFFATAYFNLLMTEAQRHFFVLLDRDKKGALSVALVTEYMQDIVAEVAAKDALMTTEEAVRTVFNAIQPKNPSAITLEDMLGSMDPCLMMTLLADYQTLHAVLYDEQGNPICCLFFTHAMRSHC